MFEVGQKVHWSFTGWDGQLWEITSHDVDRPLHHFQLSDRFWVSEDEIQEATQDELDNSRNQSS